MSLRHVLLTVLSREPNSGYGIGKLLQKELSHIWDARLQQIYGELAKLQADGLMDVESVDLPNRPSKKIYSLTAAGMAELDRWLTDRARPTRTKTTCLSGSTASSGFRRMSSSAGWKKSATPTRLRRVSCVIG